MTAPRPEGRGLRRRGTARRLAAALALAALCGCSATAARPPAVKLGTSRLTVGAAAASGAAFEASTGVRPAIVEHYIEPGDPFSAAFAGGAVPLIQVMPYNVSLAAVASGAEDPWIRSYARAVAAYGKPVILGFGAEMNGPWYPWGYTRSSPAAYIAAYRHVVGAFRAAGAGNVTWIWTVNVASRGVSGPAAWWPGAGQAGIIGVDGYYDTAPETFANHIAPTVAAVRKLSGAPVILSETSAAPAAGQVAKIADLFAGASADRLAGIIWFDLPGNKDWVLKSPAALAAFRAAVKEYG